MLSGSSAPEDQANTIGSDAWLELLHAEVSFLLTGQGIQYLVIKGPSTSSWLYPEMSRISVDADFLIRPSDWSLALDVLRDRGFIDYYQGLRESEKPRHATTFSRRDSAPGQQQVDLHRQFPGIEVDPALAFDILWRRRMPARQAGIATWFPDYASRSLFIVLHSARGALTPKVNQDLERFWSTADADLLADLEKLANNLDATVALKAGLSNLPSPEAALDQLHLDSVVIPTDWTLLSESAPGATIHLHALTKSPWRSRPRIVFNHLFPSPALMQVKNPDVGDSKWRLSRVYASRLIAGIKDLPVAVRTLRGRD